MNTLLPLKTRRIAVTRETSGRLTSLLENQGATVIHLPTIKIVDPNNWHAFDQALNSLNQFDWLICTSQKTVQALKQRLKITNIGLDELQHLQVAAVGATTAQAINDLGLSVDCIPERATAADLLIKLSDLAAQRMWLPQSEIAPKTLVQGLEAAGHSVTVTAAYTTIANPSLLQHLDTIATLDSITFCSSSSVTYLVQALAQANALDLLQKPLLISIGSSTSATLHQHGLTALESASPTLESVVETLIDHVA